MLTKNTRNALVDLSKKFYDTTTSKNADFLHDECMLIKKDRTKVEAWGAVSTGCPLKCKVPFLEKSLSMLEFFVAQKDIDNILRLLMDMKNIHTCDHEKLMCTTTTRAHAQPYCLLWEMINAIKSNTWDVETKMAVLRELMEAAKAERRVTTNKEGWKKPPPVVPESTYMTDFQKMRLEGHHRTKKEPLRYTRRAYDLDAKLNTPYIADLQDDPLNDPLPEPRSRYKIEWPRKRCAVKDYATRMDTSVPPTLQSMLVPTGNRIQDRLGLPFKTAAYKR